MRQVVHPISVEAVKKATGKTWDEWFILLDRLGAGKMEHKLIARLLYDARSR